MESMRRCLSCRKAVLKKQMLRFVRANDGEIIFDQRGNLFGRGAWLCANKTCLKNAFYKKLMFRNQANIFLNSNEMLSKIELELKKNVLSNFALLERLAKLEYEEKGVLAKKNNTEVLIFANDFSISSYEGTFKIENMSIIESPFSSLELGKAIGRDGTGVVALHKCRITNNTLAVLKKLVQVIGF